MAALAGVALTILAGCGGCRSKGADGPPLTAAAFLPAKPRSVVLVPEPAKLGAIAQSLEQTKLAGLAASAAGARGTAELMRPLVSQLGFDPRTPEGFAQAGIDGGRGLAFGGDGSGGEVLVIAVADPAKFSAYVEGLAGRQGGLTKGVVPYEGSPEAPVEKRDIHIFSDSSGRLKVAFGIRDGFAVISSGEGAVDAVGLSLSRPAGQALDASPAFLRISRKLGDRQLYAWMPGGTGAGRNKRFEGGLAVGIAASAGGVNARVLIPRGPLEVAMIRPLGKVAGLELMSQLSVDDFLAIRLGGEPVSLQPLLGEILPRSVSTGLRRAGIKPVPDILALLQPGAVLGFSINPEVDLSGGLPTDPSIARTNPFSFVHMSLVAKVKDPVRAAEVLQLLAENGDKFKMEIASREDGGVEVYNARYRAGEGMSWALIGDTLLATGGEGAFERARARLAASSGAGATAGDGAGSASGAGASDRGGRGAPQQAQAALSKGSQERGPGGTAFRIEEPAARAIFETAGSAAHLNMPRLTSALRDLPASAYGVGGFRLKEVMGTWVELLDEVKGVTASFSIDEMGLVVDADLGLR